MESVRHSQIGQLRRCVVSANFVNIRLGRSVSRAKPRLRILAGSGRRCYVSAMKVPPLLAVVAATAATIFAASGAQAQQRSIGGGFRSPPPTHGGGMHGRHRFFVPFVYERQDPVIIQREVVREVPVVVEPPPPPPPPREPYVVGKSYTSLPSGCMKLIEGGASYYLCSGDWYRQVGSGSAVKYKAVAKS